MSDGDKAEECHPRKEGDEREHRGLLEFIAHFLGIY